MERKYYKINEDTAKQAKELMSFDSYNAGSATAEYIRMADEVYNIAEKAIEKRPDEADRISFLAERYACKTAEWINRENAIGTMCPSVMVCGAGNFPKRKKEKQVAAWERNHAEFEKLRKIIDKIEAIARGSETIKSGDPYVIEKLEAKLEDANSLQEKMKAANKSLRMKDIEAGNEKLKELGFSDEEIEVLRKGDFYGRVGFPSYKLSNNNAEIHRIEARLRSINAVKCTGTTEEYHSFCKVVKDTDDMRIRILFNEKPEKNVREILKKNGFKWSPKNNAWQRLFNNNSVRATSKAILEIKEVL